MEKFLSKSLVEFDRAYIRGRGYLVGIDEAGRGPLAGDVYAAAVAFPLGFNDDLADILAGLDDSKRMSERKRGELAAVIKTEAVWAVGTADTAEIDRLNILNAALLAMSRAYDLLQRRLSPDVPRFVIVDGNKCPVLAGADIKEVTSVIKGDGKSACIAAASVIAKTERDDYMRVLAARYPQYRFDKHKGYGTKLHFELLAEHGVSDVHRKSFLKKILT